MARIRTIKPDFWLSESLCSLPEATHLLAAALLNYADDEGYFNANPALVKAACSPLREPSVSIHDSLTHLANVGYLRFGAGPDGRRYGLIVNFADHQRINRLTPSKIKALAIAWEGSVSTHTQLSESSHPEGKGREGKKEGKGTERAREPQPFDLDTADINRLKRHYPAGTYRDADWLMGERNARRLVETGQTSAGDLLNAVTAYAAQQQAKNAIGSQFILAPSKFFSDDNWRGPFPLPKPATPTANPAAVAAWNALIESDGAARPPAAAKALDAIGGWSRVRERRSDDTPKLRAEFCRAFIDAQGAAA